MEIKPIAYIHTDLPTKFGLPRQSGLVEGLTGEIVLEPEYRQAEALRGLEDFTHIWLIWDFSHAHTGHWSATVRPQPQQPPRARLLRMRRTARYISAISAIPIAVSAIFIISSPQPRPSSIPP